VSEAAQQGETLFDVGEVRLHAVVREPEGRPRRGTIVMLHGFPEFWYCWKHQLEEFGRDFRVVAPDLRGYNLSDKPEGFENYKMPHLVGDVLGLIDALDEERVILMAHDWGGAVAWAYAASHPERLQALIILNSPHPSLFMRDMVLQPEQREASQYIHRLRSGDAEAELARDDFKGMKAFIFNSAVGPHRADEEEVARYVEAWSRPGALTGALNYYRAMPVAPPVLGAEGSGGPGKRSEADRAALDRIPKVMIPVPTLVVWGVKDHALQPSLLEGLDEFVPDLEVVRIAEGSHWIPTESPEAVNRVVREYLDSRIK
jgi:pimeloyl-ACP methyl ester carboxylesterase